jgi:hypothetical protein
MAPSKLLVSTDISEQNSNFIFIAEDCLYPKDGSIIVLQMRLKIIIHLAKEGFGTK